MAKRQTSKGQASRICNAWENCMNPLRSLTSPQIDNMLELSKWGNDTKLQLAFWQIERTMPIFGVCIQKRFAGIASRNWDIVPIDNSEQAISQAKIVKEYFTRSDTRNDDGLTDALLHLSLGAFRGRSIVKPFVDENGLRFRKIENWNVLEWLNNLYWNPDAEQGVLPKDGELEQIPESEVMCVRYGNPIDIPGIQIYLRQLVGEQQWARFVEKQGIPQVLLTAPEGTPDTALDTWTQRALQIFEGGSGVLPNGTNVNVLDSSRGQDPFTSFVNHQMEMIAILSTGGTLSTIGGSTGLGSNLADVQNKQFQSLITLDCRKIANAMSHVAIPKILLHLGQTRQLCRFDFTEQDDITPQEYMSMAQQAHSMGIPIDVDEFRRVTGLSFIKSSSEGEIVWTPSMK